MTDVKQILRVCQGLWPVPSTRPAGSLVFAPSIVAVGLGAVYPIVGGGQTPTLANAGATASPMHTLHWLKRSGIYPVSGNAEGVGPTLIGYTIPSPTGWGQTGNVMRVPRSLVVTDNFLLTAPNPTAAARLAALVGFFSASTVLKDLNVDVYIVRGATQFLNTVPCNGYVLTNPYPGFPARSLVNISPVNPAILEGGDVFIVALGDTSTGWSVRRNLSDPDGIGYFDCTQEVSTTVITPTIIPPAGGTLFSLTTVAPTPGNTGGKQWVYTFDAKWQADRDAMLAMAARCRRFRFDIGAPANVNAYDFTVDNGTLFPPTRVQGDALFRTTVPGSSFNWGYSNPGISALFNEILNRAVPFFS